MKRYSILLLILLLSTSMASAQKDVALTELTIKENRLSIPFSESTRSLEIITRTEIKYIAAKNLAELLQHVGGVDIRRRGPNGVQSDINFRGSTHEQVLILLNGIKLIDPQTGHHNMNIPLDLNIIERIEIVKGPAARIYGQGAFAGAINIVTKNPTQTAGNFELTIGEHSLWNIKTSQNIVKKHIKSYVSISHEEANPTYKSNVDYTTQKIFHQSTFDLKKLNFTLVGAYLRNGFGANSFYAAPYDSTSYEQVNTTFISLQTSIKLSKSTKISPSIYYRKNIDEYTLVRDNPTIYQNKHITHVSGIQLNGFTRFSPKSQLGYGIDFRQDMIISNNLGNRNRTVITGNIEYKQYFFDDKIKIIPGISLNQYSDFGTVLLYGIDGSYSLNKKMSGFINYGTTYRTPTYTELYYEDKSNTGNAQLKAEHAINYEIGLKYISKIYFAQVSYFRRNGKDRIDWIKVPVIQGDSTVQKWKAGNISNLPIEGIDVSGVINIGKKYFLSPLRRIRFSYTFVDGKVIQSNQGISRYTLENIRHQYNMTSYWSILKKISFSSTYKYVDRVHVDNYSIWDFNVGTKIKKVHLNIVINNAFGTKYEEYPGIKMPKRWIKGIARINF